MSKPKFQDLTPEQVNDLIATKVMGYEIREEGIYKRGPVTDPTEISAILYNNQKYFPPQRYFAGEEAVYFNPYHSLDDCWIVEEKLAEGRGGSRVEYQRHLAMITSRDGKIFGTRRYWFFFHATAKQKCEAILRAIGEVV